MRAIRHYLSATSSNALKSQQNLTTFPVAICLSYNLLALPITSSITFKQKEYSLHFFQEKSDASNQFHSLVQRFRKIADSLENNTFYMCENADGTKKWICTNCGHIHEGKEAPALCPVCKHPQGYFLPGFLDLHIGF